jgi:hypothetical protein
MTLEKTPINDNPAAPRRRSRVVRGRLAACVLLGTLLGGAAPLPAGEEGADAAGPAGPATITTGSGQRYKTTVVSETKGELQAEDFRQASLLTSRIVAHLTRAGRHLADGRADTAGDELKLARELVRIVRELLPVTIVTTVVSDAEGKEVYRHVDQVQDDLIPLFKGMIAIEVVQPIAEAKKDAAEIQGIQLADAELLHTSVLVSLDYVERKINRALELLGDKPEEALGQILLAQTEGVSFVVNKEDDPLANAQHALQLAEKMVRQERYEAANANLQIAKNNLELYRALIPESESGKVRRLEQDISRLQGEIKKEGAAGEIRGFWDRVAGWFARKPGEATPAAGKDDAPRQ